MSKKKNWFDRFKFFFSTLAMVSQPFFTQFFNPKNFELKRMVLIESNVQYFRIIISQNTKSDLMIGQRSKYSSSHDEEYRIGWENLNRNLIGMKFECYIFSSYIDRENNLTGKAATKKSLSEAAVKKANNCNKPKTTQTNCKRTIAPRSGWMKEEEKTTRIQRLKLRYLNTATHKQHFVSIYFGNRLSGYTHMTHIILACTLTQQFNWMQVTFNRIYFKRMWTIEKLA